MSRSNVSRPSSRSRGAPPTSQAGVPARARRTTSSAFPALRPAHGVAGERGLYERGTRVDRPQVIS